MATRLRLGGNCLAAVLAMCCGCYRSTKTIPAGRQLVEVTINGQLCYVRDGQRIRHGWFGGGLVEAVEANKEAKDAAGTYFRRNAAGKIAYVAAATLALTAFGIGYRPDTDSDDYHGFSTSGLVLLGVSVSSLTVGGILYTSAQSYRYEAINIYNSGIEP